MRSMTMIGCSGGSGALMFLVPDQELLVTGTVNRLEPRKEPSELALALLPLTCSMISPSTMKFVLE